MTMNKRVNDLMDKVAILEIKNTIAQAAIDHHREAATRAQHHEERMRRNLVELQAQYLDLCIRKELNVDGVEGQLALLRKLIKECAPIGLLYTGALRKEQERLQGYLDKIASHTFLEGTDDHD